MKALIVAFAMLLAFSPLEAAKKVRTPKSASAKGYKTHKNGKGPKASKLKKQNASRPKVKRK